MSETGSVFATPPDAETEWKSFEKLVQTEQSEFFDGEGPIAGARAPGRLDVMGGVADYSGSLVLEMPIAEAASVAWQWRSDRKLRLRSLAVGADGFSSEATLSLDDMVDPNGSVRPLEEVRNRILKSPGSRWAGYLAGCYWIMLKAYSKVSLGRVDDRFGEMGANILLKSDVPLGAGVSSSAAIEVATMSALSEAAGIYPSDMTLASWCQRVENEVVGAPCGIMDQVACALGRENALTVLRCQPHELLGTQRIPTGWRFLGLDSRVKHSVGGSRYTKARVGAFMGLKAIQLEGGGKLLDNYLCKMSPEEFATYRELIPEVILGSEYQKEYGLLPDSITRVDPKETYRPRSCAEHPVLENNRVRQFVGMLQIAEFREEDELRKLEESDPKIEPDRELMRSAGELMYEAHASYNDRIDLGSPETDLLVEFVRKRGIEEGLYGAKITGGGSGGTVAILCETTPEADTALLEICKEYERSTGVAPRPFVGSSPGAVQFGARQILRG